MCLYIYIYGRHLGSIKIFPFFFLLLLPLYGCITHIYKRDEGRKEREKQKKKKKKKTGREGGCAAAASLVIISTLAPIRIDLSRDPTVRGLSPGLLPLYTRIISLVQ